MKKIIISEPVKIEIFTSPTCPYCPKAVKVAKELAKGIESIKIIEISTGTREGSRRAAQNDVRSVPTLFIRGPGYLGMIGYVGAPSREKLMKMVEIAQGKAEWKEEEGLISRIAAKLKIKL